MNGRTGTDTARGGTEGGIEATSGRAAGAAAAIARGPLQLAHDEGRDGDGGTEEGCRDHPFDDRCDAQTSGDSRGGHEASLAGIRWPEPDGSL